VIERDILSSGVLAETEDAWATARKEADDRRIADGQIPLEHGHWDWRNKAETIKARFHRLVAVIAESEVQGLMAVLALPRAARVSSGGLLYVDYLETAPWNLKGGSTPPRFLGVGTVLLAEAVRMSVEAGLEGRVGLHSLPEAEPFYDKCRMTRQGPDSKYFDLTYYEFRDLDGLAWLKLIGVSP
jgi:hypothetical protein